MEMGVYETLHYGEGQHPKKCSCKACERDRELRSCEDKTLSFDTELEAHLAAWQHNRERAIKYTDMEYYKCRHCPQWHIGHDHRIERARQKEMLSNSYLGILNTLAMAS